MQLILMIILSLKLLHRKKNDVSLEGKDCERVIIVIIAPQSDVTFTT